MFIKGRETPMTKNEIAKSEKTMFPDILKKSNFPYFFCVPGIAFGK